jgi:hypothetical protein
MHRIIIAVASALILGGVQAQESGTKITGGELSALVTGANVTHVNRYGSVRRWTNEADGTLVASTSNQKHGSAMSAARSGQGKWSINDGGKFCIEIDWKREDEKWCAFIVKATDGSYYLNSVDPARKIEFAK